MVPFGWINYWGILVSVIVTFLIGWIWFLPGIFGNTWMKEAGKTKEQLGNQTQAMVGSFIAMIIMAFCLQLLVIFLGVTKITGGIKLGLVCGVGFNAMALLVNCVNEKRSMKWFLVTAGYQAISILIMAMILGVWRKY